MVKVTENQIFLTKGDSAKLDVAITVSGETYDYSNDTVKLGVKKQFSDAECVIEKTVDENGSIIFVPDDTKDLPVGTYFYDLKIVTEDNDVCTVIAASQFVIGHSVLTDFTAEEQEEEPASDDDNAENNG